MHAEFLWGSILKSGHLEDWGDESIVGVKEMCCEYGK
jgi:hypothetical protein